jgi:hypothetical protein
MSRGDQAACNFIYHRLRAAVGRWRNRTPRRRQ